MKNDKKSNISWIGFFIDLIIYHLLFGWGVAFFGSYVTTEFILAITPFFLTLAVADYITIMAYRKRQQPPWKAIFIPLLFINAIVFGFLILGPIFSRESFYIGLGSIVVYVFIFVFLIIDLILLLLYVFTRHP